MNSFNKKYYKYTEYVNNIDIPSIKSLIIKSTKKLLPCCEEETYDILIKMHEKYLFDNEFYVICYECNNDIKMEIKENPNYVREADEEEEEKEEENEYED